MGTSSVQCCTLCYSSAHESGKLVKEELARPSNDAFASEELAISVEHHFGP